MLVGDVGRGFGVLRRFGRRHIDSSAHRSLHRFRPNVVLSPTQRPGGVDRRMDFGRSVFFPRDPFRLRGIHLVLRILIRTIEQWSKK